MTTLTVSLGERSYPIYIGPLLLEKVDLWFPVFSGNQVLILTNDTVGPLYLNKVSRFFSSKQLTIVSLPDGEQYKTIDSVMLVIDRLLEQNYGRNTHIIALGGGVIGDIAGFVAACYQRGVPFVQIPTTLLAQVDSSVGGKTGVNHPRGKNMIGAFYQPRCVVADTCTLDTLPHRELSAGLAEVIKYGLIRDLVFFEWLESHIEALLARDPEALTFAIERSCKNKAEVVAADERESGERATLNLGHTFGHAIETGVGYGTLLHGEAVAIGMCQAADLSHRLGWITSEEVSRVIHLLERAHLPVIPPAQLDIDAYLNSMAVDKKNVEGQLRFILLERIGKATWPVSVEMRLLQATLSQYGRV